MRIIFERKGAVTALDDIMGLAVDPSKDSDDPPHVWALWGANLNVEFDLPRADQYEVERIDFEVQTVDFRPWQNGGEDVVIEDNRPDREDKPDRPY